MHNLSEIIITIGIIILMFVNVIQCYRLKNHKISLIMACILLITPFIIVDSILYLALLLCLNSFIISDLVKAEKLSSKTSTPRIIKTSRKYRYLKKIDRIS